MLGDTQTTPINLGNITKVPVTMWSGLLDQTCYHSQAEITKREIGERVTYFRTVPWATHTNWGGELALTVLPELVEHLKNPERKSYPLPRTAELLFLNQ